MFDLPASAVGCSPDGSAAASAASRRCSPRISSPSPCSRSGGRCSYEISREDEFSAHRAGTPSGSRSTSGATRGALTAMRLRRAPDTGAYGNHCVGVLFHGVGSRSPLSLRRSSASTPTSSTRTTLPPERSADTASARYPGPSSPRWTSSPGRSGSTRSTSAVDDRQGRRPPARTRPIRRRGDRQLRRAGVSTWCAASAVPRPRPRPRCAAVTASRRRRADHWRVRRTGPTWTASLRIGEAWPRMLGHVLEDAVTSSRRRPGRRPATNSCRHDRVRQRHHDRAHPDRSHRAGRAPSDGSTCTNSDTDGVAHDTGAFASAGPPWPGRHAARRRCAGRRLVTAGALTGVPAEELRTSSGTAWAVGPLLRLPPSGGAAPRRAAPATGSRDGSDGRAAVGGVQRAAVPGRRRRPHRRGARAAVASIPPTRAR